MQANNRAIFIFLFFLGACIRLINIWQPLDGHLREAWREADVASISRNYYREDMNICYPRIDWRGDGPGYVEMEFPALPWLIAIFYKLFGYHEIIGKLLSCSFSLVSLLIFIQLSRHLLPNLAASAASMFFVLNPLLFRTANTLQPESLMLMLYILAVYSFIRWLDEGSWKFYVIALVATVFTILAKATAAHIGLFFLLLIFRNKGIKFFKHCSIWLFGALSLLPALLWYSHAHELWLQYGNSLGVSNESHWIGWDFFTNPYFIKGILASEIHFVWMPMGLIIIVAGLFLKRLEKADQISFLWLTTIFVYYVIAVRTAADDWAYYYHIVSVPPVAILVGNSINTINNFWKKKNINYLVTWSGVIAALIISAYLSGIFNFNKLVKLALLMVLSGILIMPPLLKKPHFIFESAGNLSQKILLISRTLLLYILIFLIPATYLYMAFRITGDIHPAENQRLQKLFECAKEIDSAIPKDALIISSGGVCRDQDGYPVAYNASYMFFWLDRKGFNICQEDQSIDAIQQLIERGAKFFIAEKAALKIKPEFENELKNEFVLVKECSEAYLFDLREPD